jgi:hypothetical protein
MYREAEALGGESKGSLQAIAEATAKLESDYPKISLKAVQ